MRIIESSIEKMLYFLLLLVFTTTLVYSFYVHQSTVQNYQTLVNNCKIGNEFRENEKALWNYLLSLPPQVPPTTDQQKRINDFKVFLDKTFMTRDCSKL